jgi:NADPH:quinone reductase
MRAALVSGFGPPDRSVHVGEAPMPVCGADDVLIKVAAAGINPVDWKECEGNLVPFYGAYADRWIPGYDAAGTVHQVGAQAKGFKIGDRVVAFSDRRENGHNGTFAEYVRVLSNAVSRVPPAVDLVAAAAIPTAALTGYQALHRPNKAALQAGDTVLIHGASGGVGSYAVQFAKALGLHVAASCSASNVDYVKALGAELVLDYAQGCIPAGVRTWRPQGLHAIIDCVSGNTLPDALDMLRPHGRLVSIATLTQDGDVQADIERARERGFTKVFSIMEFDRIGAELAEILKLMAAGLVMAPPMQRYPLEAAAMALQHMKQGGVRGKLVLQMSG